MEKEKIINKILEKEWKYFSNLNNIGGRADCQDNREDFIIMRKSQWETFNEETLLSYLEDLNKISLFSHLSQDNLERLLNSFNSKIITLDKNEILFNEGEVYHNMCIVNL